MNNLRNFLTEINKNKHFEAIELLGGACFFDAETISPLLLGTEFENLLPALPRRNLGAHYTSESNILKLIKPLFLDELWAEFEKAKNESLATARFSPKIIQTAFPRSCLRLR